MRLQGLGAGSGSQQSLSRPLTAAALQSSSLNPQMIPTTNVAMTGTPILEWNGREWITPQPNSIAAVAGQQGMVCYVVVVVSNVING